LHITLIVCGSSIPKKSTSQNGQKPGRTTIVTEILINTNSLSILKTGKYSKGQSEELNMNSLTTKSMKLSKRMDFGSS